MNRAHTDHTDEKLLSEFLKNGDIEVLGELYSRYMHLVYGVCLKYLNDRDDAMDAVMQIFEKLHADLPDQKIMIFRNWLYVVTKNFCLMQIRAEKSHNKKEKEWVKDFMEFDDSEHPIDSEERDKNLELEDCIEKLKAEQQECIRHFYYENRCYKEIGFIMDLDEKKIKSHLQNAKRNLKLCLDAKNARQE